VKVFFAAFAVILLLGVAGIAIFLHLREPSSLPTASTSGGTSSTASSALNSIPAPTGGGDSSDLQSPNVPMTDANKVADEDAKNRAEQNWKADHTEAANATNSNVTDEDRKELDDSEKANVQPVNRPK
jgi:hypothetical protein